MPDVDAEQTALYRHYNAAGELLYVGISLCVVSRLAQHRRDSAWFREIANIAVEWHPTREAACDAEVAAIRAERPIHNIANARSQCRPHAQLMRWLESQGLAHTVDDAGLIKPEFMRMTPEEVDALADRLG